MKAIQKQMRRDTNYEGFYVKKEKFYQCSNCPQCYKELEEVERHVFFTHVELHDGETCCIDKLTDEARERVMGYYTVEGNHLICTECNFEGHTVDKIKNHVHKEHVWPEIKSNSVRSAEWIDYKSAPFCWDGVVSPPDPRDTRIEELEKEKRDLLERQTQLNVELEETRQQNALAGPHIKLVRESSQSEHGVHAVQYTPSPRYPGGWVKTPKILLNVSNRPRRILGDNDEETPNLGRELKSAKSKLVDSAIKEACRDLGAENSAKVLAATIDKQDKENIPLIQKHSRTLTAANSLSPVESAELQLHLNLSDRQVNTIQKVTKSKGIPAFAPQLKRTEAKRDLRGNISREFYDVTTESLQIKRQGESKYATEQRPVVRVKDFKGLMQSVLENEIEDLKGLETLEDGTKKVNVGLTGDAGGGSMKHLFMLMDQKDGEMKEHVFLMYEAADTIENAERIYRPVSQQLEEIANTVFSVKGSSYSLKLWGIYDMSEQDTILGKQNSSSNLPCTHCQVPLRHLRAKGWNEKGEPHSRETCCNFEEKHIKDFYDFNGRKAQEGNIEEARKEGKRLGNVVSRPLLMFPSTKCIVPPLLHISMGLINDTTKEVKKDCAAMDHEDQSDIKKREQTEKAVASCEEKIDREQAKLQGTKKITNQYENMKTRLKFAVGGNLLEVRKTAEKFHNHPSSIKDRQTCSSQYCLLFPVDQRKKMDGQIMCSKCSRNFHLLCEAQNSLQVEDDTNYICNECEKLTVKQIEDKLDVTIQQLRKIEEKAIIDINSLKMFINKQQENIEQGQGPRLRQFYSGLRTLKTKEGSYHGGDLNGKDSEKILKHVLECRDYTENVLLKCIRDTDPEKAKAYHELYSILGNVHHILRHPPKSGPATKMDDDELETATYWCEAWAKRLPVLFPGRNLTRKGHTLSIHLPETLRETRSYYLFYKAEQTGEAVHATFNKLDLRWKSVRPHTERLWGMISDYEAENGFTTDIIPKRKRKSYPPK